MGKLAPPQAENTIPNRSFMDRRRGGRDSDFISHLKRLFGQQRPVGFTEMACFIVLDVEYVSK
jgi:hypothetical protein